MDGIEAALGLEDGMDGMLRDDEDDDDGMLLDDEEDEDDDEEEGIDGMELCEDCWLVDSQPASTRAVVVITNSCLTVDLFMLKCPFFANDLQTKADNQYLSKTGVRKDLLNADFMNFFLQLCAWSHLSRLPVGTIHRYQKGNR